VKLRLYLLGDCVAAYEVGNMLKRPITVFKVLCALRVKENVHNPVSLLGLSGAA